MARKCFIDFDVEHLFRCHAAETLSRCSPDRNNISAEQVSVKRTTSGQLIPAVPTSPPSARNFTTQKQPFSRSTITCYRSWTSVSLRSFWHHWLPDFAPLFGQICLHYKYGPHSCIASYLIVMYQQVQSENSRSPKICLHFRIPRGSVIGHLLFTLYVTPPPLSKAPGWPLLACRKQSAVWLLLH